ncbi:3,4-dihydroxy-2-butanone-4-phosphate synthase, partial [Escherichia sp. HC-CC]
VLTRGGHTEATIDLMTLAGFKPAGVLCELTNDDGTMARAPECIEFANKHNMALVTIEDLVAYRQAHERKASYNFGFLIKAVIKQRFSAG